MKTILTAIAEFLASKIKRRLLFIGILVIIALVDFFTLDVTRRTFVFYDISNGNIAVEDRMLVRSRSREVNITRYTQEALLGPVSPNLLPIFPRETKLKSLLYRNDTVFVNLSADAALPPIEGGQSLENFRILHDGILRNFPFVRYVRFFIDGQAVFSDEFRRYRM